MSLAPGRKLGPYEILAPLGAGGMGQVFKARDTRLDRVVAIKILPPEVSADEHLRQRFEREGRTVAALNHPNICMLHDIGRHEGMDFLVMEYLEGQTLAQRLHGGPLTVDEVFRYGIEVADALDKAHRLGIIHRDLKPANIMLTRTGAKLMDFGLAKPPAEQIFDDKTRLSVQAALTASGALVGTLQYMAPEQLEGRGVDARTDIFGLGAVLYEMATGHRAFDGASQASIIAAILRQDPPAPSTRRPSLPESLDHIVERCLAKEPDQRWQTARDVALELQWRRGSAVEVRVPKPAAAGTPRLSPGAALTALVAFALGLLLAGSGWLGSGRTREALVRAHLLPPDRMQFQLTGDFGGPPALAPDGSAVAFVAVEPGGRRRLWLRRLDAAMAEPLAGTDDATFPFWAPDSRSLAFFAGTKLKRIDLGASSALTLCDAPSGRGGSWSAQGTILFAPTIRDGLYTVSAQGGSPVRVTELENGVGSHRWPAFLPDGRHFLYLAVQDNADRRAENGVYLSSLAGRAAQRVVDSQAQALFASDHLLFLRDRTLWAQPFDPDAIRFTGAPVAIARAVLEDPTIWRGVFDASSSGRLVYQMGETGTLLTWYDRDGHERGTVGDRNIIFDVSISPAGTHAAVNRGDPADIWVYEFARGTGLRVTFDERNETLPVWSPDGRTLSFMSFENDGRAAVMSVPASGGEPHRIAEPDFQEVSSWSPDGDLLVYRLGDLRGQPGDLWVRPRDGGRAPYALTQTPFAEYHAAFSPDGRWIAYTSNESGREEVYVTRFVPAPAGSSVSPARSRVQVSVAGGALPRWRRTGGELFYLAPDRTLMAAAVAADGESFEVRGITALFTLRPKALGWAYDASPDGQRFLVNSMGDEGRTPLEIVLGWTSLAARTP